MRFQKVLFYILNKISECEEYGYSKNFFAEKEVIRRTCSLDNTLLNIQNKITSFKQFYMCECENAFPLTSLSFITFLLYPRALK